MGGTKGTIYNDVVRFASIFKSHGNFLKSNPFLSYIESFRSLKLQCIPTLFETFSLSCYINHLISLIIFC